MPSVTVFDSPSRVKALLKAVSKLSPPRLFASARKSAARSVAVASSSGFAGAPGSVVVVDVADRGAVEAGRVGLVG